MSYVLKTGNLLSNLRNNNHLKQAVLVSAVLVALFIWLSSYVENLNPDGYDSFKEVSYCALLCAIMPIWISTVADTGILMSSSVSLLMLIGIIFQGITGNSSGSENIYLLSLVAQGAGFILSKHFTDMFRNRKNTEGFAKMLSLFPPVACILLRIFAVKTNGAYCWISLFGKMQFQVTELFKISVVFCLALYRLCYPKNDRIFFSKALKSVILSCAGLAIINEGGTAVIIVSAFVVITVFEIKDTKLLVKYLSVLAVLGLIACIALFVIHYVFEGSEIGLFSTLWNLSDKILSRISSFIQSENFSAGSKSNETYQSDMSKTALSLGGLFGCENRFIDILPNGSSDYIFSVVTARLGAINSAFLIIAFTCILLSSVKYFSAGGPLVSGTAAMIYCPAIISILMSLGKIPVLGIPMPFISNGGTSFVISSFLCSVLISAQKDRLPLRKDV